MAVGDGIATVAIGADLAVSTVWPGGERKAQPDAPAEDVSAVKAAAKELKAAIGAERRRVEDLFATGRTWPIDDWRKYYLDHPLTGLIARGLIWVFEVDAERMVAIPTGSDKIAGPGGDFPMPASGRVHLWHPVLARTDEVIAWRDHLVDQEIRQPIAVSLSASVSRYTSR